MIGTWFNVGAILLGGAAGLLRRGDVSALAQQRLKLLLGAFTVYAGVSLAWSSIHGSLPRILKQLLILVLALAIGSLLGKLVRLQRGMNHLGQYARRILGALQTDPRVRFNDSFAAVTILCCAAPLAVLGPAAEGLKADPLPLLAKSVMDGLTALALVRTLGPGILMAVLPVFALQGTLTLATRAIEPMLAARGLAEPVVGTTGLLVFCVALLIFELKRIEIANYLPSLVVAPAIAWLLPW